VAGTVAGTTVIGHSRAVEVNGGNIALANVDPTTGGAPLPRPDGLTPDASLLSGPQPLDVLTPLTAASSQALHPEPRAPGLFDSPWVAFAGPASAAATDALFAALADGAATAP
jgi:hypothetical protein